MKKTLIAAIILFVLAAASISVFLIFKKNKDNQAEKEAQLAAEYQLISFNSDSATKIEFDCPDGKYTTEFIDDKWRLTSSDDFKMSNTYAQGVSTYMSTLTALKDYGEATDESKAKFGLSEPTKVTIYENNNSHTVYVGDADPTGVYYYVMVEGKNKIYAIDSMVGGMLDATRLLMKDPYLVPYSSDEIVELTLIRGDDTIYELSCDSATSLWSFPEQYSHLTVDNSEITAMLAIMTRITAQEFLDENLEDYSKYGFDKPFAEMFIKGTDGAVIHLLFSRFGNNTQTYTHVLNVDTGQVMTVLSGDADFIEDTPASYIVNEVCPVSIHNLSAMNFTYNGKTDNFEIDMDKTEVIMNGTSISAIGNDAYSAFNNFYYSITYLTSKDVDITISPELSELVLAVEFVYKDDSTLMLEICKADEENCYVFFDGKFSGYIVDESDISSKNSIEDFYNQLVEIVNP